MNAAGRVHAQGECSDLAIDRSWTDLQWSLEGGAGRSDLPVGQLRPVPAIVEEVQQVEVALGINVDPGSASRVAGVGDVVLVRHIQRGGWHRDRGHYK